jgi:hypothetical protein
MKKINQYAVSLLFVKQTGSSVNNSLRTVIIEKTSDQEALGAAIMIFSPDSTLRDYHISLYTVMIVKKLKEEPKVNSEIKNKEKIDISKYFTKSQCQRILDYMISSGMTHLSKENGTLIDKKDFLKINVSQLFAE